jgi:hypothetical protein
MRVVETGHAAKIAMFRETRANARARGDRGMVRNMDVELARMGAGETAMETTQDATVLETVVPEKPRRGRRPMPRCEHDVIAARCPECMEEVA